MDTTIIDFREQSTKNIWQFIPDKQSQVRYGFRNWEITTCLHNLTCQCRTKYISGTLKLAFYTKDDANIQCNYCFDLDAYKEYVKILSEYLPFKYEFKTCKGRFTNYIEIEVHNMYKEFMFILTTVRYGYEIPSSPFLLDILNLYRLLSGNLDIVNCINLVLGFNTATHGHETQCLFPYISYRIPQFIKRDNLLSKLIGNNISLQECFRINLNYVNLGLVNSPNRKVDESFFNELSMKMRLDCYINYINKWERKFLL